MSDADGTAVGRSECPIHGGYRADEHMCPDCFHTKKCIGGDRRWDRTEVDDV